MSREPVIHEDQVAPTHSTRSVTRLWRGIKNQSTLILLCSMLSICIAGIFYWQGLNRQEFATVDLSSVVAQQEAEFTKLITDKNATDKDREKAYELVQRFGKSVDAAMTIIQSECKCSLMVSGALVMPHKKQIKDYTPRLKVLLGISQNASESASSK